MSLIPNTTCRRCHRQYPSFRGRCPYCGTRKAREVRSPVPETDSAVRGTEAARSAAESLNWQMLIGAVLLIAVFIVTIIVVSSNVKSHVTEEADAAQATPETQMTALPTATPSPSPSPTPPAAVTAVTIYFQGREMSGFMEEQGTELDFTVTWFPVDVSAVPVWTSTDEDVVTVEAAEDGQSAHITVTGESGYAQILVDVNGTQASCDVWAG